MTTAAVQSAAFASASAAAPPPSAVDALLASSRTAGVLNTRELAGQLSSLAANDPNGAQTLYQAVSDGSGRSTSSVWRATTAATAARRRRWGSPSRRWASP